MTTPQPPYGQQPPMDQPPYQQPPAGPQPPYQQPGFGPASVQPKKGLAITALVLGIIAIAGCFIPVLNILSIIIGFVAVVFGVVAIVLAVKGRAGGRTMGIVGTALAALAIIIGITVNVAFADAVDEAVSDGTSISAPADSSAEGGAVDGNADATGDEALAEESGTTSDSGIATFGDTYTYEDGVAVTISEPEEFTPGEYAIGADGGGTAVAFDITIDNGSDAAVDPSLAYETVASGGVESQGIYDDGIGDTPSTSILPDKSVTYTVGYLVDDAGDVQMDYSPGGFDYSDITFVTE